MKSRSTGNLTLSPLSYKGPSGRYTFSGNNTPVKLPKINAHSSRTTKSDSFNFFATKVEIDNNEEEHAAEQSVPDSLVRLTYYQGHRSARWDAFSNGLFKPNYKDENRYRNPKIKDLLPLFLIYKEKLSTVTGKEVKEVENKILEISESILALYNINLNVMSNPVVDSHAEFLPVKSRSELVRGLAALIPEICRFPYSFYAKIDLISLSICGIMLVVKSDSKKLIEKRLFNGLFPLGLFVTEDQVVRHFYRIITSLVKSLETDFDRKLTRTSSIKRSRTMLMNATNFIVSEAVVKSKRDRENNVDYQSKLLRGLMTKPNSIIFHASDLICWKGARIKNILESIDPDGINIEFWNQLGSGEMNESLEFLEASD